MKKFITLSIFIFISAFSLFSSNPVSAGSWNQCQGPSGPIPCGSCSAFIQGNGSMGYDCELNCGGDLSACADTSTHNIAHRWERCKNHGGHSCNGGDADYDMSGDLGGGPFTIGPQSRQGGSGTFPAISCGRVQVDVQMEDTGTSVAGAVYDSGVDCGGTPPTNPPQVTNPPQNTPPPQSTPPPQCGQVCDPTKPNQCPNNAADPSQNCPVCGPVTAGGPNICHQAPQCGQACDPTKPDICPNDSSDPSNSCPECGRTTTGSYQCRAASCKCDGMDVTPNIAGGQTVTFTAKAKVENASTNNAYVISMQYMVFQNDTQVTQSEVIPASLFETVSDVDRYKTSWQYTIPNDLNGDVRFSIKVKIVCGYKSADGASMEVACGNSITADSEPLAQNFMSKNISLRALLFPKHVYALSDPDSIKLGTFFPVISLETHCTEIDFTIRYS